MELTLSITFSTTIIDASRISGSAEPLISSRTFTSVILSGTSSKLEFVFPFYTSILEAARKGSS